jgi:hypothetical protein
MALLQAQVPYTIIQVLQYLATFLKKKKLISLLS